MASHEEKYCPRCKARFECKVGSIILCQCSAVKLTFAQREYLNIQYTDCLCATCIKELRSEYNLMKHNQSLKKILGPYFKEQ
ncbi:cysteine-rich CWC family protein [Flavimarina sp. Hel_I_48]|uniref:cysteine-rich CWC family protein n=1 Tax=Flavimarina sp. Hel_I_48 TaxID=1392488 RepID=UPI0004DF1C00|nr:cysteine-rich CWC family protein [Flavimarina sp. Hel_I_48]